MALVRLVTLPFSAMASAASNLIASFPFMAKSVCPLGMVAVVRLLKVTNANPLPPSEVLQSRVTLLGLGYCARALDPGEQKNVAANAVTTNIVGRFIEFSFGFCWASPML